jgi:hypothetical protein
MITKINVLWDATCFLVDKKDAIIRRDLALLSSGQKSETSVPSRSGCSSLRNVWSQSVFTMSPFCLSLFTSGWAYLTRFNKLHGLSHSWISASRPEETQDFVPVFYGTRKFITVFTRAPALVSYPEPDQFSPYHPILSEMHVNIIPTCVYAF